MLRKRPALSVIAVLTLALGIGANTAIFSVINAVFLRPLPFPNAKRIYLVGRIGNRFGGSSISMPIFIAWQGESRFFDHIALYAWLNPRTLTGSGEAEQFVSAGASTDLFAVLGVHPALGREFLSEEGKSGGANVVMISDQLWRNRFHSDPDILGRKLTRSGARHQRQGGLFWSKEDQPALQRGRCNRAQHELCRSYWVTW